MNNLTDIKNPKVLMKNNVLVQSKYSLSLNENRIFLLILYKLQKHYDGSMCCEIHHDEFKDIIKRTNDRTVKKISEYLAGLMQKSIFFMEKKKNNKLVWGQYNFISGYQFDEETQTFRIDSPKKIYDLLDQYLKTGYTPANLALLFSLKNYNAQRLYDLIRVWSGTKQTINYTVEDIKMYLMLEDSYPQYANFKRRVILPAIKELNETGYFEIDIKENKVGRKVDSIDFIVRDLDKRKYFTKDDTVKEMPSQAVEEVAATTDNNTTDNKEEPVFKPKFSDVGTNIQEPKECDFEPCVLDETLFTKGTLRSFKLDFKGIDFKNKYMEKAFNDAVMVTLDRDDVETIKATSYKFFKGTLDNKVVEYKIEEQEDIDHQRNIEMFW
ncbi:MAG: replication initiation protein [Romboutsia sp.]